MKYTPKLITLLAFTIIACKSDPVTIDKNQISNNSEIDSTNFLPKSTTNQIIEHAFYTLSYHEKFEQAEWVAYYIKPQNTQSQHFDRPFFIQDEKVTTQSADWKNYKKSGYDKGHLCAAADMKFSKTAFNDTFLTSNVSPQKHDFNEGIWNRLEQKTRYWASKYDGVFVVTGGVLTDDLKTIGQEDVAVPNYFYKIIMKEIDGKKSIISFLVPAQDSDVPLYKFVTTVDSIEKITGIDFFPNLQDNLENELEKTNNYKNWSFN